MATDDHDRPGDGEDWREPTVVRPGGARSRRPGEDERKPTEPPLEPTRVRATEESRKTTGPLVKQVEPPLEPTRVRASEETRKTTGPLVKQVEPPLEATAVRQGDPLIGAMLGEYRVLAPLGSGGGGLVYRGEHPVIGRAVAIKVLHAELNREDPAHARRFLEEARAVSAARHPNIIDVFSFGHTPAGEPYLVMELLEGEPLHKLLQRRGQLRAKEALELIVPVLSALAAAHAAGITHRDLKPANIFLVTLADGTTFPKLLDFGLARRGAVGARVRQTSVGGTPLYIAPEQAMGDAVGPQTDLYSLGCVLYEMLAGRPPFTAVDLQDLIDQHVTLAPPSLREQAPHVPPELERLVLQLLEKDPARRPSSALAVREELSRLLSDAVVAAAPTRVAARAVSPARRAAPATRPPPAEEPEAAARPTAPHGQQGGGRFALVIGAALAALTLLGVGGWIATRPPPPLPPRPAPAPVVAPVPEEPDVEPSNDLPVPEDVEEPPVAAEPPEPTRAPTPPQPPPTKKAPRHTVRQVKQRWRALSARVRTLPDDLRRAARLQLEEARFCTDTPDECWRELSDLEATFFPR